MTDGCCESHDHPVQIELPVALPLLERRQDTHVIATLVFPLPERQDTPFRPRTLRPGQFIMMWIPDLNEKPYAISHLGRDTFEVTVIRRGSFSTRLHECPVGTKIGFRGPYGRGYWGWEHLTNPDRAVIVAGGCGMAPLRPLAELLPGIRILQGAATEDDVLFLDALPEQAVYTEDGSLGESGYPTVGLEQMLRDEGWEAVYACGPEVMSARVVELCGAAGVPCQVSLERYMKCGFGLCGQCECDGHLVCKEGPVFSDEELAAMPSFGRFGRDGTGARIDISTHDQCIIPHDKG